MSNNDNPDEVTDGEGTTETSFRWKWLATVLAFLIGVSLPLIVIAAAIGWVTLASIPSEWYVPYILGWMMVMVYALGEDTFKAVQEWRGGP